MKNGAPGKRAAKNKFNPDHSKATVTIQFDNIKANIEKQDIRQYQTQSIHVIKTPHPQNKKKQEPSFKRFLNRLFRHAPLTPIDVLQGGLDNNYLITF